MPHIHTRGQRAVARPLVVSPEGTKAHGRILFWEGASLWILSAPPVHRYPKTDPHSHHAVQVTLALTGRVDFDGDAERVGGVAVAIAPDSLHAFEGTGLVAHLFVASDSRAGREIARGLFSSRSIASIHVPDLDDLPARLKATLKIRATPTTTCGRWAGP